MGVAGGIAAASAVSGIAGAVASGSAGSKQAAANQQASQQALQEFQYNAAQEQPFVQAGQQATNYLTGALPTYGNWYSQYLNQAAGENNALQQSLPGAFTQANLESTPGYQFTLGQGLKATQNAAAAKGLGISGAALKGAAKYATGLADSTYTNRFNEQQQIFNDQNTKVANLLNLGVADSNAMNANYNRVMGLAGLGQNAAAQVGNQGNQAMATSGQFLSNAGAANAAGTIGAANALTGGLTNGINSYMQYNLLQNMLNNGSAGNGYTAPGAWSG